MRIFLALFLVAWAGSVPAVEPGEVMSNLLLEERARSISKSLRCLQCRNESIDESNSGIASDLRVWFGLGWLMETVTKKSSAL